MYTSRQSSKRNRFQGKSRSVFINVRSLRFFETNNMSWFSCRHVCFKLEGESDIIKMLKKCVLQVCQKSIQVLITQNFQMQWNRYANTCIHMNILRDKQKNIQGDNASIQNIYVCLCHLCSKRVRVTVKTSEDRMKDRQRQREIKILYH